jgi:drug/metabolite transporter (DMT)-like permease
VAGSALIGALCSVLYRPYFTRYGALPVSTVVILASVMLLGFMAAGEGFCREKPVFTGPGWLAVLGIGSGAGYYLWLWTLGRTSPTRVAVFLSLSPVAAALLSALWLSEPISLLTLAGLVCIGLGLWLAHRVP